MWPWKWLCNQQRELQPEQFRPEQGIEGLILALDDPGQRRASAEAIIGLGTLALSPLLKSLDEGSQGIFAAGQRGDHLRVGRVLESLRVRVEVLERIPDRRSLRR